MPRKMEPSFEIKKIIWDVAATMGLSNYSAIWREADYQLKKLHQDKNFFEETPDIRKMTDIILNDIQKLSPEIVIAKLPRHVWPLRKDYQYILDLDAGKITLRVVSLSGVKKVNVDQSVTQAKPDESKPKLSDEEFANQERKERESLDLRGIKLPTKSKEARLHEIELCKTTKKIYDMFCAIVQTGYYTDLRVVDAIKKNHLLYFLSLPLDPMGICVLSHLQSEMPELTKIKSWGDLIITESDIPKLDHILSYRAKVGHFKGTCDKCRPQG